MGWKDLSSQGIQERTTAIEKQHLQQQQQQLKIAQSVTNESIALRQQKQRDGVTIMSKIVDEELERMQEGFIALIAVLSEEEQQQEEKRKQEQQEEAEAEQRRLQQEKEDQEKKEQELLQQREQRE